MTDTHATKAELKDGKLYVDHSWKLPLKLLVHRIIQSIENT